ncbi:DUF922 domain-containing protein [Rufibacter quisquiliarum]|uniref:Putative secreted Zn-dependent protease n=1 Tax=Rufibacter quisquiliarum TaxID=1549639 RepID=A0A839GUL3_9BACT|nr:DUF922 domain-containing protein [Rufibacter quisquiliarum]MBA9077471.1 putative secreted Zn-dependent protease [Rufibacter quisquiliarum]
MSLSFISLWLSTLLFSPSPAAKPEPKPAAVEASVSMIPWSGQKRLTWDDFAGSPASENQHHALTSTNMEMKVKCEKNQLKFRVEAVFNPRESWTKNRKSAALLAHEQLHFDLTELHARMLRKRLAELPNACSRGAADLNRYANEAFTNWHKEQDLYDSQCHHGLDKARQQEWVENVAARLLELEQYAS